MKTLYININNRPISPSDDLVILDYDLLGDFFFYLGERIAKGCNVQNENALITDFNTPDNKQDYDAILSQWAEIKSLLFGENVSGSFEFNFPSGYLHWLRYNEDYNHIYDKNFSNGGGAAITIDLEELYEDSIESLQRKIMRKLKRDDLYLEIDEIVFNDEAVNRKSRIIRAIKDNYDSIGFIKYEKWNKTQSRSDEAMLQDGGDLCQPKSNLIVKNIRSTGNNNTTRDFLIFLWETGFLFIDNNNELILQFPNDTKSDNGDLWGYDNYSLYVYLWKIFEYEYAVFQAQKRPSISFPLILFDILEEYGLLSANEDGVVLSLSLYDLSKFVDDFNNEIEALFVNLSRYLRHRFSFEYHCSNKTNTLVSWGITKTYFAYITKTKLLFKNIYKQIAIISTENVFDTYNHDCELIVVSDGCKNYILNQHNGQLKPLDFDNIPRFYENLAKVLKNEKWGYIDMSGNLAISFQFEEASNFSNGTAQVKLNGKNYLINKRGELFEGYIPVNKR